MEKLNGGRPTPPWEARRAWVGEGEIDRLKSLLSECCLSFLYLSLHLFKGSLGLSYVMRGFCSSLFPVEDDRQSADTPTCTYLPLAGKFLSTITPPYAPSRSASCPPGCGVLLSSSWDCSHPSFLLTRILMAWSRNPFWLNATFTLSELSVKLSNGAWPPPPPFVMRISRRSKWLEPRLTSRG